MVWSNVPITVKRPMAMSKANEAALRKEHTEATVIAQTPSGWYSDDLVVALDYKSPYRSTLGAHQLQLISQQISVFVVYLPGSSIVPFLTLQIGEGVMPPTVEYPDVGLTRHGELWNRKSM